MSTLQLAALAALRSASTSKRSLRRGRLASSRSLPTARGLPSAGETGSHGASASNCRAFTFITPDSYYAMPKRYAR